jgi:peptide/nickel transport system permease protein
LVAVVWSTIFGLIFGAIAAARKTSVADGVARVGTVVGISIPNFWLALLLLLLFGVYIPGILPAGGWVHFASDPIGNLRHIVLPAFVLGMVTLALVTRTFRASVLDALTRDYVTFARSMGMRESRVMYSVAAPNAMIPTTTVIGIAVGSLISGAIIVETVFAIPGVGSLLVDAFQKKDYSLGIGATLFMATCFVIATFCVDVLYAYFNPRIRDLYLRRARLANA